MAIKIKGSVSIPNKSRKKLQSNVSNLINGAINFATDKTYSIFKKTIEKIIKDTNVKSTTLFKFIETKLAPSDTSGTDFKTVANRMKNKEFLKSVEIDIKRKMLSGLSISKTSVNLTLRKNTNISSDLISFVIPIYFLPFDKISKSIEIAIDQRENFVVEEKTPSEIAKDVVKSRKITSPEIRKRGIFGEELPLHESFGQLSKEVSEAINALRIINKRTPEVIRGNVLSQIYEFLDPSSATVSYLRDVHDNFREEAVVGQEIGISSPKLVYNVPTAKNKELNELEGSFEDVNKRVAFLDEKFKIAFAKYKSYSKQLQSLDEEDDDVYDALLEDLERSKIVVKKIATDIREYRKISQKLQKTFTKNKKTSNDPIKELFEFLQEEGSELGYRLKSKLTQITDEYLNRNVRPVTNIRVLRDEKTGQRTIKRLGGSFASAPLTEKDKREIEKKLKTMLKQEYEDFKNDFVNSVRKNLDPIKEIYQKNIKKLSILLDYEFEKHFLLYINAHGGTISGKRGGVKLGGNKLISDMEKDLRGGLGKFYGATARKNVDDDAVYTRFLAEIRGDAKYEKKLFVSKERTKKQKKVNAAKTEIIKELDSFNITKKSLSKIVNRKIDKTLTKAATIRAIQERAEKITGKKGSGKTIIEEAQSKIDVGRISSVSAKSLLEREQVRKTTKNYLVKEDIVSLESIIYTAQPISTVSTAEIISEKIERLTKIDRAVKYNQVWGMYKRDVLKLRLNSSIRDAFSEDGPDYMTIEEFMELIKQGG